jgi:uroporphyrinogen III methyltransferase/synthase
MLSRVSGAKSAEDESRPGKVWLVGAGPGDPGLITVRGRELLGQADVVLYDALSHPALLEACSSEAELHNVGKRGGSKNPSQENITSELIRLARAGRKVVRLKGGDPSLFARGAEEAEALAQAGIEFEIVPGVPSPIAMAAYAGIPLTHRDFSSSVTFITGSDRAGKEWSPAAWQRLATATETICVLMGMQRIEAITRAIIEGGRSPETPSAVVQWAARPEQRVLTAPLAKIAAAARAEGLSNPALIVVGDVVRLREHVRWYDRLPLFGRRLLVPRPEQQAASTAEAIRRRAAEPILLSSIEIGPAPDPRALREAARRVGEYDFCLFTSANGVERFFEALASVKLDARAFGSCRVGAIGPKTAQALLPRGIVADLTAKEFVGESLAQAILEVGGVRNVLIPRAKVAREELPELLRSGGLSVDVVAAYETRPTGADQRERLHELLRRGELDVILFTSSSTVDALVDLVGESEIGLLSRVTLASIGPITSATAARRGLEVAVTAETYTVEGLLDALERHYQSALS